MNAQRSHRPRSDSDRGFTLVELIIVVATMGFLTTAVATAIIAVLHNEASVSTRLDDSRDVLNLATWLPQDVNSTPVGTVAGTGIEPGALESACSTPTPGVGLLRLTWTEQLTAAGEDRYRVSYRTVTSAGTTAVVRYSCLNGGAATARAASRALPNLAGGGSPFAVTTTASHVVLSVTQHPGAANETTVRIEADSKNPAIASLPAPPAPPTPVLALGASTVNGGSAVTATVTGFGANEAIAFSLDHTYSTGASAHLGTATADSAGTVATSLTMPITATHGVHTIFAQGTDSFASAVVSINNATLVVSSVNQKTTDPVIDATGFAGGKMIARVTLFDIGELVTLSIDSTEPCRPADPCALATFQYDTFGNKDRVEVTIPASTTGGLHVLTATGSSGRRALSVPPVTVKAALSLTPATVTATGAGLSTSAVLHGARAGETITYTLGSAAVSLSQPAVSDVTGSSTTSLTIPANTSPGDHTILATGSDASSATATLTVRVPNRNFTITTTQASVTAGGAVTLRVEATSDGVTDPTLNGTVPITVTGATNGPNGSTPAAPPTTAAFTSGVATIAVNVVNAVPTTVTVTDSARTGTSPTIAVTAGAVATLSFDAPCPASIGTGWTTKVVAVDRYGNKVSGVPVALVFAPAVANNTSIATLDTTGWTTTSLNSSYSSSTDAAGTSPGIIARPQTQTKGGTRAVDVTASTPTSTTSTISVTCTVKP